MDVKVYILSLRANTVSLPFRQRFLEKFIPKTKLISVIREKKG